MLVEFLLDGIDRLVEAPQNADSLRTRSGKLGLKLLLALADSKESGLPGAENGIHLLNGVAHDDSWLVVDVVLGCG